ncbi:MAG: HTH-type transcriptional regulator CysB, partial [Pseudonocardia sp.]|nr:HTH-type transcriptional regulator CysB [Pseudonocardia sp.]
QLLEAELGVEIFRRTRNRIVGLTEPGRLVVERVRRILGDVQSLASLREDLAASDRGTLTIATTHTQARYVLPGVIGRYVHDYPNVQISLKQGDPEGICRLVDTGEADLAIGTEIQGSFPRLVDLPCFALDRVVVAPQGHPILEAERLTLDLIASYPVITYDSRFSGYWKVRSAFERAGLSPRVVLSAIDADVCKTYVRMDLGIAILTAIAFDAEQDAGLAAVAADHLFESSTTSVKLRSNIYLRPYLLDFLNRLSPRLTPGAVQQALARAGRDAGRPAP